ncbi:MAG: Pr6Pr family membrane protein [Planctomycetota bacterium]|nr:Pr6Pr family membrane protein [Planctomycetota bacterium]
MIGVLNLVRWVLVAFSVVAIFFQANHLIAKGRFELGPFFSFFTIQANLIAIGVLVMEALGGLGLSDAQRAAFRGASVLYLTMTGLVYAVLLSQLPMVKEIVHPLADGVHHLLMPLWVLFDWVVEPPRYRPGYRRSLWWLSYPLGFLFFSLIRGAITGWYPYPFLSPHEPGGWMAVGIVSGVILLISCGLIGLILQLVPRGDRSRQGATGPVDIARIDQV